MRFKASENLIDLFVGQLVYTNPATPVRELLQNAYDACALQSVNHPEFKPLIRAKVSRSGNLFEVDDNGVGIDRTIIEESFSMVGRPKTEVPSIGELIRRGGLQVGIGLPIRLCLVLSERFLTPLSAWKKFHTEALLENPSSLDTAL